MPVSNRPIHITSEIGPLKSVLLHRPGRELENITPDTMKELLFDDIPYLEKAQQEHDAFADVLRKRGAEVLYLDSLVTEALDAGNAHEQFVAEMVRSSGIKTPRSVNRVTEYLGGMATPLMVRSVMAGIRRDELPGNNDEFILAQHAGTETLPFYMAPMPNLYFTRDPAASIGDGLTINRMKYEARRRESLFMKYVVEHHPRFSDHDVPVWYDRENPFSMEGGDELVLSSEVMAVGISQRTSPEAIEIMAHKLFEGSEYKTVIGIQIPDSHAFMHLDTVFTMIDTNKFSIHPEIQQGNRKMNIYVVNKKGSEGDITVTEEDNFRKVLCEALGLESVTLIECGNGDPIAAPREQWNDGSNTLAVAPGVVVTYDRNYVTNNAMRDAGLEVIEVEGAELGRGRGGPRCMSMPLIRDEVKS